LFHQIIDVSCISVEDDIDETTFLVHPLVPSGTKLKELAGTPDYDLGKGKVEAFIDAVSVRDCVESGNIGVATYPWLSETDSTSPVSANKTKFNASRSCYSCISFFCL